MEKILKNTGATNKYQFKPFDTFETHEVLNPKYTENLQESQQSSNGLTQPAFAGARQVTSAQNSNNNNTMQPIVQEANTPLQPQQNELIENLLKKIDELSTNMIKMEI
jgi:hypothetical protein